MAEVCRVRIWANPFRTSTGSSPLSFSINPYTARWGLIQEIGNGLVVRAVRLQFQLAVGHWLIGCSAVITPAERLGWLNNGESRVNNTRQIAGSFMVSSYL
jgi:hypothetical protein